VWNLTCLVSHRGLQHVVYDSPDSLVGTFVDVDEPGLSARTILVSLHTAGEGTSGCDLIQVRRHIEKYMWVLLGSEMM
jgi:hypothetical protein